MTPTQFIFAKTKSNLFFFFLHNTIFRNYQPLFFCFCYIKIYFRFQMFFPFLPEQIKLMKLKSTFRAQKFVKSNSIFFPLTEKIRTFICLFAKAEKTYETKSQNCFWFQARKSSWNQKYLPIFTFTLAKDFLEIYMKTVLKTKNFVKWN